eukprot:9714471-Alexandrium_andersonii.AAC.1
MIELGESRQYHRVLLFPGWGKSFDKTRRHKLLEGMERMGVPVKIVNMVGAMHKRAKFCVEIDGIAS